MPADGVEWVPKEQVLSFEEMVRIVRVMSWVGISKVRITGGEPLVRRGLTDLVKQFSRLAGIEDISLTTNGVLLAPQAHALFKAGLRRIISASIHSARTPLRRSRVRICSGESRKESRRQWKRDSTLSSSTWS